MNARNSFCLLITVAALCLILSQAIAEEVVVTDCQGNTRTSSQIEPGSRSIIKATFKYNRFLEAGNLEAAIKESSSGKAKSVVLTGQTAIFKDVGQGVWALCTAPVEVDLDNVTIQTESRRKAVRVAALAGVGAIISGVIVGANRSSSSDRETESATVFRDAPLAGSSGSSGSGVEVGGGASQNDVKPGSSEVEIAHPCAQKAAATGLPCFIDDEPTPISPFR